MQLWGSRPGLTLRYYRSLQHWASRPGLTLGNIRVSSLWKIKCSISQWKCKKDCCLIIIITSTIIYGMHCMDKYRKLCPNSSNIQNFQKYTFIPNLKYYNFLWKGKCKVLFPSYKCHIRTILAKSGFVAPLPFSLEWVYVSLEWEHVSQEWVHVSLEWVCLMRVGAWLTWVDAHLTRVGTWLTRVCVWLEWAHVSLVVECLTRVGV